VIIDAASLRNGDRSRGTFFFTILLCRVLLKAQHGETTMRPPNRERLLLTASAASLILIGVAANVTYRQSGTNGTNSNCSGEVGKSIGTNCQSPAASNQKKRNAKSNGGIGAGTSNGGSTTGMNGTNSTGVPTSTGGTVGLQVGEVAGWVLPAAPMDVAAVPGNTKWGDAKDRSSRDHARD
jgi:hypothetical protein